MKGGNLIFRVLNFPLFTQSADQIVRTSVRNGVFRVLLQHFAERVFGLEVFFAVVIIAAGIEQLSRSVAFDIMKLHHPDCLILRK